MNRLQIFNSAIRNSVALKRGKLNRFEGKEADRMDKVWRTDSVRSSISDRDTKIKILSFVLILNLNRVESSNSWRGNKDFSYFHIEILGIFEKEPFPETLNSRKRAF